MLHFHSLSIVLGTAATPARRAAAAFALLTASLLSTPSAALEVVGSVGGACRSIAAQDGVVFLCEGMGLTVLDGTAPGAPVPIERLRFDSPATCVRVHNDVAYVGTADGMMRLYDITNPATPAFLGAITLGAGMATGAAFDGNLAFFGCSQGVEIVDVSNPALPTSLSIYTLPKLFSDRRDVCLSGGRMFVVAGVDCRMVDVTNPAAPTFLSNIQRPAESHFYCDGISSISLSNGRLCVVWDYTFASSRIVWHTMTLHQVDGANPADRIASTSVTITSPRQSFIRDSKAYVLGLTHAWMAPPGEGQAVAEVFDISQSGSIPTLYSSVLVGNPYEGAWEGSSLFMADEAGATKVEELSAGDAMTAVASYTALRETSLAGIGAGVYVAIQPRALLLAGIDAPAKPEILHDTGISVGFSSASLRGRYLYLCSKLDGLDVRYITPQDSIANVTTLDPLEGQGLELPLYGNVRTTEDSAWLAFSAGQDGNWEVGLVGIDTTNPIRPTLGGIAKQEAATYMLSGARVAVSGSHAVITADKLYFFDISNVQSPTFISDLAVGDPSGIGVVSWTGDSLLVQKETALRTVDVSDINNPVVLPATVNIPYQSVPAFAENNRVYLITSTGDLLVYHFTESGVTTTVDTYEPRGNFGNVKVYGGHVYAVDSEDGLLVMKTNFPDHLAQRHLLGSDTGAADQNSDGVIDAADLVLAMAAARGN